MHSILDEGINVIRKSHDSFSNWSLSSSMRRDNSTPSWKKIELRKVLNEIKVGTSGSKYEMNSSKSSWAYDNFE